MTDQTENTLFTQAVLELFEETFERSHGIYLDRETSIFETLVTLSAEEASRATSDRCATIASHVAHMTYYIDILLKFIGGEVPETDWDHIWSTVSAVTDDEWSASVDALRDAYQRIRGVASTFEWQDARQMGGAMGVIAHNAYHLGEIRQMLCHVKAER